MEGERMDKFLQQIKLLNSQCVELENFSKALKAKEDDLARYKQEQQDKIEQKYKGDRERILKAKAEAIDKPKAKLKNLNDKRQQALQTIQNECNKEIWEIETAQKNAELNNQSLRSWLDGQIKKLPIKASQVSATTTASARFNKKELQDKLDKIHDSSLGARCKRLLRICGYDSKKNMSISFVEEAEELKNQLNKENAQYAARARQQKLDCQLLSASRVGKMEEKYKQHKESIEKEIRRIEDQASQNLAICLQDKKKLEDSLALDLQGKQQALAREKRVYDAKFQALFLEENSTERIRQMITLLKGSGMLLPDWETPAEQFDHYAIGKVYVPISFTDSDLVDKMGEVYKKVFSQKRFIAPLVVSNNQNVQMAVNYHNDGANAYALAQYFILQKLRCSALHRINIYFSDVSRGMKMGVLNSTVEENKKIGLSTANDADTLRGVLKSLSEKVDDITGRLGVYKNIYEYNENNTNKIKETILILCDVIGVMDKEMWENLKVLWDNAERCGIHIIFISNMEQRQLLSTVASNHTHIDASFLYNKGWKLSEVQNQWSLSSINGAPQSFGFMPMKDTQTTFIQKYRDAVKELKINNDYNAFFDSTMQYPYKDGTNELSLPVYMQNKLDGELREFKIDSGIRAHTIITGCPGAGKTTFLKMLIASIVMHYHPDDVALWLVDYSGDAFSSFLNKRAPHIRFLSLEKTENFTYSFLDYANKLLAERSRLFQRENVEDIERYRQKHGAHSLPRVVLIIDEFHVLTSHIRFSPEYKTKLSELVRQGRKYGLSCIFSDQTLNNCGFDSEQLKQVENRISMRNRTVADVKETLAVSADNYTPEMEQKMQYMQQGDLYCKEYDSNNVGMFTIEAFKSLRIQPDDLNSVLDTAIARGDKVEQLTEVYVSSGQGRKTISRQEHQKVIEALPIDSNVSALPIYLGEPTEIKRHFLLQLKERANENIMIVGDDHTISDDLVVGIVHSVLVQKLRVVIFADPQNDKFFGVQEKLSRLGLLPSVEVYTDYGKICSMISEFSTQAQKTFPQRTILIWIGLFDMYYEFNNMPKKAEAVLQQSEKIDIKNEREIYNDPKLQAMAEALGCSVEEIMGNIIVQPNEIATTTQGIGEYNAIDDIATLLRTSGRVGLQHVLLFNNIAELDSVGKLKDCEGMFAHKLLFRLGRDAKHRFQAGDSFENIIAIPDTVFYKNIAISTGFRPFIME